MWPACGGCCSCSCCCRCKQLLNDVRRVPTALSDLSLFFPSPFLLLCLFGLSLDLSLSYPSPSRAFSAALLAARHTLRLPLALRILDPSPFWIHHALRHHVVRLSDTALSTYVRFMFSSSLFSPTPSSRILLLSLLSRATPAPLLLRGPCALGSGCASCGSAGCRGGVSRVVNMSCR